MKKTLILSMLSVFLLVACMGGKQENSVELTESGLNPQKFVTDVDGKKTGLYILRNKNNMEVCVTKLLQKSGIRKNEVIELIYRGFI